MRILESRILEDGVSVQRIAGLSSEDKPTAGIATGSVFEEVDTGKTYKFAEGESAQWYDQNPTPETPET
jgi:hypothetical protein